ncbi:hypothetical protein PR202_ga21994 [Eleusine coracana subsp. coracana]|uniref:KIB1-4 beta-propeller domain-containing protein n=1 Tax=Eleusine coracana subsp. coracana TaxID=191504 RepID=A0AAV5D2F3_ELECO|nr:hypothetical protein PR202_ga21994 [Eleusine coracana subsp. coracana]
MRFCADNSGEAFDGRLQKRSRLESDSGVSMWAGLQSDVLGVVLGFLPCLVDRGSMRSVCRHWRAVTNDHALLPPRHPLLVLPKLRFSCLCSGGTMTSSLRAWMPEEVVSSDIRFMGSFKALPILNSSNVVNFTTNGTYRMSFGRVVLSAPPDSGSKMKSWHVCDGLAGPKDLAFYQGKLYVLQRFLVRLYAFELDEDEHGVIVSRVEHCVTTPLHNHRPINVGDVLSNLVVWRGKLLLIIRSTNPCELTKIHNFEGDSIFIDSCSCNSFPAGLHDAVEGDLIYFVDQYSKYDNGLFNPSYDTFVYNMKDGKTRPFAVDLSSHNFGAPKKLGPKGYVLVPEEFITEREEARKRHGQIDLYLPARHFTTVAVVEADGSKKFVFSFKKKEKVASESKEDDIFLSYSSEVDPEGRAACRKGVKSSHTDEKKPTTAPASGPSGKMAAAAREGMTRLPKLEVVKILSQDPTSIKPYNVEALRRLALEERPDVPEEVLRMVADAFNKEAREQFIVFQDWVFEEYKKKSCVEVPDEFIEEMEDAQRRQGGQIDLYLPHRYFTTVVEDDGSEKLVFSFKKKEKVVPDSKSNEDNMFLSFSAEVESKIKAAFCMMLLESSEDEEESDEEDDRGDSDEDD